MRLSKYITAMMFAGLFFNGASAGTITESGLVAMGKTDYTTVFSVTGGANASTFAGFNAALGTLTGVVVTFSATGSEIGTLTNDSASSQTFRFFSNSNLAVLDAGSSAPAALVAYTGSGLTLSEPVNSYTLAGGASTSILPTPNAFGSGTLSESTTFTGSNAAQFIGNNFSLDLSTFSTSTFAGGGGNIATNLTTKAGGTISIEYDYSTLIAPVTEPASMAVLGAGLLGLVCLRYRKQA